MTKRTEMHYRERIIVSKVVAGKRSFDGGGEGGPLTNPGVKPIVSDAASCALGHYFRSIILPRIRHPIELA